MSRTIEHKKTGQRREVSDAVWTSMCSRGASRSWRTVSVKAPAPVEVAALVDAMKRGRKKEAPEQEEAPAPEVEETE